MNKVLSIGMPVYNAAKYLRISLDSILAAAGKLVGWNVEIVCVDDGSTDESVQILDEYAALDSRIEVIHQQNGGGGKARNVCLANFSGDIVTWLDADDLIDPGVLEHAVKVFEDNPGIDLLRVRIRRFPDGNAVPWVEGVQNSEIKVIAGIDEVEKWAVEVLTAGGYCCSTFVRRGYFSRPFPEGVQYAEDSLFSLLNAHGKLKVAQSDFVGYYYRDTLGSIMKKNFPSAERLLFFKTFRVVCDLYSTRYPEFAWMGWFHLVNWVMRPGDVEKSREIRNEFKSLVNEGYIFANALPVWAIPSFRMYCFWGWRLPIKFTYTAVKFCVKVRNALCAKS